MFWLRRKFSSKASSKQMYYLKRKENTACWALICLEEFFVFRVLEKVFPCKTFSKYLKAYNVPAY